MTEFEELEAAGFDASYVRLLAGVEWKPMWSIQELIDMGFYPRGTKMKFIHKGGYDEQREQAESVIGDQIVTVDRCHVGSTYSYYTFEGIKGSFNSVMFEVYDDD